MSEVKTYKVGQILKSDSGQYTKIISVRNGVYGISGWVNEKSAKKSTIAMKHVNRHGLANARLIATSGKANAPAKKDANKVVEKTTDTSGDSNERKLEVTAKNTVAQIEKDAKRLNLKTIKGTKEEMISDLEEKLSQTEDEVNLEEMTVEELTEYAKDKEIDLGDAESVEDVLKAIQDTESDEE